MPFGNKNAFQKLEFANSEVSLGVYTDLKGPPPPSAVRLYIDICSISKSL